MIVDEIRLSKILSLISRGMWRKPGEVDFVALGAVVASSLCWACSSLLGRLSLRILALHGVYSLHNDRSRTLSLGLHEALAGLSSRYPNWPLWSISMRKLLPYLPPDNTANKFGRR